MRHSPKITLLFLSILLSIIAICSINMGALSVSFATLWHTSMDDTLWQIWLTIRLPRVLLAIIVGIALAVSGAIMQGLFRNPLADPTLLGISSGASLCVALVIVMPFLLLPSTVARTLVAPAEIPVGMLTSLIGGPYFLWLILRQKGTQFG